jgi:hypothetical protein
MPTASRGFGGAEEVVEALTTTDGFVFVIISRFYDAYYATRYLDE